MTNTKPLIAIAALAAASFTGAASAAQQSPENWVGAEPVVTGKPLTRAEVVADLNLWNRAGLSDYNTGDNGRYADAGYARRLATYQRLRSGPEYLAEVQRLEGGARAVAGNASAASVN